MLFDRDGVRSEAMYVLGFRTYALTGKNGLNFLYNLNFSLIFRDRVDCGCKYNGDGDRAATLDLPTTNRFVMYR